MLLTTGLSFGQEKVTTTLEEYNYLSWGYADDIAKGKDVKAGYELKELFTFDKDTQNFNVVYYQFIEIATSKTKAVLVKVKKKSKNKVKYFCIPFNNKNLTTKYNEMGASMIMYYSNAENLLFKKLLYQSLNKE